MTSPLISLTFIWLLPLTAHSAVTSGHNPDFTDVITGSDFTWSYLTAQEASSLTPLPEVSGHYITTSGTADINLSRDKTTGPSSKPATSSPKSPIDSKLSQSHSSTAGVESTTDTQLQVTTLVMTRGTSQASNPTTTTRVTPTPSSFTQSPDTGKTWTSKFIPTAATSDTSTGSSPITTIETTHSNKPLSVTSKTPFIHTTRAKKRQHLSKKGSNHSEAVAGIIGGALVLMMVGFLVIFIKKRKLQKQQITTTDWAGPSPFLEGGADGVDVTLRSSNRISLSSFLPQRLSKRLSLLPEADEELEDMTAGTTFGDKRQQVDAQGSNRAAALPEMKSTVDYPEMVESSVSVASSQTNHLLSTGDTSETAQLSPEPTRAVENSILVQD